MSQRPPRRRPAASGPTTTDLGAVRRRARPVRGRRDRGPAWVLGVLGILALVVAIGVVAHFHRGAQGVVHPSATAKRVLIVLLPGYGAGDLAGVPTPNLDRIAESGTQYTNAFIGVAPAIGPVAAASLGTGTGPAGTGLVGSVFTRPDSAQPSYPTDRSAVLLGSIDQVMEAQGPPTLAGLAKDRHGKATILAVGGERCSDAAAAATWQADYIICAARTGHLWKPQAVAGHALPANALNANALATRVSTRPKSGVAVAGWKLGAENRAVARYTVAALRSIRPTITIVSFPELAQLASGLPARQRRSVSRTLLRGIDGDIEMILKSYRQHHLLASTAIVVTSDEVPTPTTGGLQTDRVRQAVIAAGGESQYVQGGGAVFVGLKTPLQAPAVSQALQASHMANVDALFYKTSHHGAWSYALRYIDPLLPDGVVQFYQLELQRLASATSADVVAVLAPGIGAGPAGKTPAEVSGGFQWNQQHIPLIVSGAGVARSTSAFPATLLDVAPTVSRLLNLPHARFDGVTLANALLAPSDAETQHQNGVARSRRGAVAAARLRMSVIG